MTAVELQDETFYFPDGNRQRGTCHVRIIRPGEEEGRAVKH